jgi:hypothetical protein
VTVGFIAVYRWRVEPEHEAGFRRAWSDTTLALRERGGYGSCLGRAADGTFVAVAPWPDRQAREAAFDAIGDGPQWPPCERLDPIEMQVTDDLWQATPFAA